MVQNEKKYILHIQFNVSYLATIANDLSLLSPYIHLYTHTFIVYAFKMTREKKRREGKKWHAHFRLSIKRLHNIFFAFA